MGHPDEWGNLVKLALHTQRQTVSQLLQFLLLRIILI